MTPAEEQVDQERNVPDEIAYRFSLAGVQHFRWGGGGVPLRPV